MRILKSDTQEAQTIVTAMQQTSSIVLGIEDDTKLAQKSNIDGNSNAVQSIQRTCRCLRDFSTAFRKDSSKITYLSGLYQEVDERSRNKIKYRDAWGL